MILGVRSHDVGGLGLSMRRAPCQLSWQQRRLQQTHNDDGRLGEYRRSGRDWKHRYHSLGVREQHRKHGRTIYYYVLLNEFHVKKLSLISRKLGPNRTHLLARLRLQTSLINGMKHFFLQILLLNVLNSAFIYSQIARNSIKIEQLDLKGSI